MDTIYDHKAKRPERDFFQIYTDKNVQKVYYHETLDHLIKYELLYGKMSGLWSYTNHEASRSY